jgi:putative pyruvate formate lyase activating enzyme
MAEKPGCLLCPRRCGVSRENGERGWCGAGPDMEVASLTVHTGEEPFFTGGFGVGNVFFFRCNMGCVFCQNHQISRGAGGRSMSPQELADELLEFQRRGCPTVGLVSPTQFLPRVRETLIIARSMGLEAPVIWNSNAYEEVEALESLEGLVDIFLPDLKYSGDSEAMEYSSAPGYGRASRAAVREMFRQVGPLTVRGGIARRGLCVRHLVLPNDVSGTMDCLRFLADLSPRIQISLMSQYNPLFEASGHPLISRRLRPGEYWKAVEAAESLGLENTLIQDPEESPGSHVPDFFREDPFFPPEKPCSAR